jgi:hypothetical protein
MKALLGLLCDPCLHLLMIAVLLARLSVAVPPDDDDRLAFAGRDASCPICQEMTFHLDSCPRSVVRMACAATAD